MKSLNLAMLKSRMRRGLIQLGIGHFPQHPYREQFMSQMDLPEVHWASRFVLIASTPRSGSHYLGHMLGATKECGIPLEYLHGGNRDFWALRFGTNQIEKLFPQFVKHRTTANGTFALKAHWQHFEPYLDSIDSLTRGIGIEKTIWISRSNLLSQAISEVIAQQTGVWISGAIPTGEATFDYEAIVRNAREIRFSNLRWRDYIARLPQGLSISIVYEDLLADGAVRDEISRFLNLESSLQPSMRTRKQGNLINSEWRDRFSAAVRDEDLWILERPEWLPRQL